MSEIIFLSNVRLSFPHLAEPQRQVNEQTGKERISYNCEFLMPQDHPGFQQFMQRYGAIALEKWKEHAQTVMGMIQQDRKLRCFGRGEEKINKKTFQPYDGYAGHVFITAGRDSAPQMIQADGQPVDPNNTMAYQQLARKMYGGCRVNAAVKPWKRKPSAALKPVRPSPASSWSMVAVPAHGHCPRRRWPRSWSRWASPSPASM